MAEAEESITQGWIGTHKELYQLATRHPFLLSIRDGSLDLHCFKTWLGQDYFFVRACVRFIASILVKVPKDAEEADIDTILGGLCSLEEEISWFRGEASTWGLQFDQIPLQIANINYCRPLHLLPGFISYKEKLNYQQEFKYLEELSDPQTEFATALAALWAIEVVYNDSFAYCLEPGSRIPPELETACKRWGCLDFKRYCQSLQRLADKYLLKCPTHVQEQAAGEFVKVLSFEIGFWNMSVGLSIS